MKSYNTRRKKNYIEDKVDNPKKGRKKKNNNYNAENFEKQEMFLSERCNENNINMFANEVIQNPIEKHIYSPKKPDKINGKIINNKIIPIKRYSVQKERSSNKRRNIKSAFIQSNNDIIVQLEKNCPFSPNKRTNNKKKNEEHNTNQEIKTKSSSNIPQKTQYKPQILPKGKSGRGRKPKNLNINMNEISNKANNINEKNENDKKKRATRSCTTRDKKKKNENVTDIGTFKEEKTKRNKETKGCGRKNKKNERKTRRRGEKKCNNNMNRDKSKENVQRKKKSRSHMSNPNRDKEKEKESKIIKQEIKLRRRDYSSPRIQHKQIYNDNTISVIKNNINEELSNNLRNQPLSPPKNFNSLNMINNPLSEDIHELKNDFFFTDLEINLKRFVIIVKKNYYKDKNKKDIFVVNKISNEKNLGKKRKRSKTKKRNGKDNSKKPNTRKKNNNDEIKEKNIRKGKSQKVIVDPENIENSLTLEEVDKLKSDLNYNKSKSNNPKGKKGTRKHKSMKKEEKKIKTEKIKEEDINSVDSFSEPDLDMHKYDCFNHRNNNYRTNNVKNNQTIQYKNEEPSQNTPFQRNSFQQNTPYTPNLNNLNNNYNNFNTPSNKKSTFTTLNYNLTNNYRPFYDQLDLTVPKDNMLSSSMKDLGSETANFFEASSNNCECSFPLDFEEKIDVKEDKTYYAKNSKYIKYHPIDKYLSPLSNEDKKPIRARIALPRTRKINFSKKNENKQTTHMDSDNDITDITSSNNDLSNYSNDLPSILNIPRIKPFREEHSKMIKDKLNQEGIKLYQTEDERFQREEKNLYIGSFMLYDEKNNIKVSVPCYRDNSITKEFMNKKRLTVIEFQEDNDIDTDEEQLELEIQRNNNALLNFMKKVNKNKNYVDENLVRKRKQ